ncbi:MAG: cobalamin biosynthesis protein, partial [Pseudomonadales bacterium]|nr:cobalamin biosynthesis protein [Pseudomonadales bacterium]
MKMRIALLASVLLASFSFGADLPEQESLRVMQALIEGDLDGARSEAERLSARHPHFRAAQVLRADL